METQFTWLAILAMFATFRTWCNRDVSQLGSPFAAKISTFFRDASYGLYILQFFVYMSIGYLLRAYTALPPWAMYILLFLVMFTLTPLLYLLIRRIPVVRYCVLGVSRKSAK